jgi:hypothetical protein
MTRKLRLLVLAVLAIPIGIHELFHGLTDSRSPLHSLHFVIDWANPLFEDESLVLGHVLVNTCVIAFGILGFVWIWNQGEKHYVLH